MQDAKFSTVPVEPGFHLSKNTSECDSDVPRREAAGFILNLNGALISWSI